MYEYFISFYNRQHNKRYGHIIKLKTNVGNVLPFNHDFNNEFY
jgi:hypothetical protein